MSTAKMYRTLIDTLALIVLLAITGHVHADTAPVRMVPSGWNEDSGSAISKYDGFAWYVLPLVIPADWTSSPLRLDLGAIDDADETFFDGSRLGGRWGRRRRRVGARARAR